MFQFVHELYLLEHVCPVRTVFVHLEDHHLARHLKNVGDWLQNVTCANETFLQTSPVPIET